MNQIELGSTVKDRVTGFKGVVVARVEYINGCIQYGIRPKMKKSSEKRPDAEYVDVEHLEVVISKKKSKTEPSGAEYMSAVPKR